MQRHNFSSGYRKEKTSFQSEREEKKPWFLKNFYEQLDLLRVKDEKNVKYEFELSNEQKKDFKERVNDRYGKDGDTLLHLAAIKGCIKVVLLLLDYGADLNILNRKDYSPLELAIRGDEAEVVEVLINHSFADYKKDDSFKYKFTDKNGKKTPILHYAAAKGAMNTILFLVKTFTNIVNEINGFGQTAIYTAIYYQQKEVVDFFLRNVKIDFSAEDYTERTILVHASDSKKDKRVNTATLKKLAEDIYELILEKKKEASKQLSQTSTLPSSKNPSVISADKEELPTKKSDTVIHDPQSVDLDQFFRDIQKDPRVTSSSSPVQLKQATTPNTPKSAQVNKEFDTNISSPVHTSSPQKISSSQNVLQTSELVTTEKNQTTSQSTSGGKKEKFRDASSDASDQPLVKKNKTNPPSTASIVAFDSAIITPRIVELCNYYYKNKKGFTTSQIRKVENDYYTTVLKIPPETGLSDQQAEDIANKLKQEFFKIPAIGQYNIIVLDSKGAWKKKEDGEQYKTVHKKDPIGTVYIRLSTSVTVAQRVVDWDDLLKNLNQPSAKKSNTPEVVSTKQSSPTGSPNSYSIFNPKKRILGSPISTPTTTATSTVTTVLDKNLEPKADLPTPNLNLTSSGSGFGKDEDDLGELERRLQEAKKKKLELAAEKRELLKKQLEETEQANEKLVKDIENLQGGSTTSAPRSGR